MHIQFKVLTLENLEWARQLHNDPEVLRMLTNPHPVSKDQQTVWFGALQKSTTSQRLVVLINGNKVGLIRLDQIDKNNHSVCIGLDIDLQYRGQGYAKPIYNKLFYECFVKKNFNRVWLLVADYNNIAKHIYKTLGMKQEGKQKQALYRNGTYHDYIMMSLLKHEWESL